MLFKVPWTDWITYRRPPTQHKINICWEIGNHYRINCQERKTRRVILVMLQLKDNESVREGLSDYWTIAAWSGTRADGIQLRAKPPRTISIQEIFHKTLPESCPALKRENVRQSSPRWKLIRLPEGTSILYDGISNHPPCLSGGIVAVTCKHMLPSWFTDCSSIAVMQLLL